jgi:hypothetical protein
VLGLAGGYLFDGRALAQTAADEEKKQKAAKVTMLFATEYKIEDYVKYPIMQAKYKDNIETQSKGPSTPSCTRPGSWASAPRWRRRSRPARCTAARCRSATSAPTRRWST